MCHASAKHGYRICKNIVAANCVSGKCSKSGSCARSVCKAKSTVSFGSENRVDANGLTLVAAFRATRCVGEAVPAENHSHYPFYAQQNSKIIQEVHRKEPIKERMSPV